MWRYSTCVLALLLWLAARSHAATISTNTIISAENSFPGESLIVLRGGDSPTAIQMVEGGEAGQITLANDSILNYYSGHVEGSVTARDESRLNLLGGTLPRLNVRGMAVANIFDGHIQGEIRLAPRIVGPPTLNVFGGSMGDILLDGGAGPTQMLLGIHGGVTGFVGAYGTSFINFTGGSVELWALRYGTVAHWSGGELRQKATFLNEDAVLHVYGRDLYFDDAGASSNLSGVLLDGTVLDRYWFDLQGNSRLILHNAPEPGALALALTACFACWVGLRRHGRTV